MKIYLVTSGHYSDNPYVHAVFSTLEKADKYISDHTDKVSGQTVHDDGYRIEPMIVDEEYTAPVWVTEYFVALDVKTGSRTPHPHPPERRVRRNPRLRGYWNAWRAYRHPLAQGHSAANCDVGANNGEIRATSYVSEDHALKLAVEGRQAVLRAIREGADGPFHGEEEETRDS